RRAPVELPAVRPHRHRAGALQVFASGGFPRRSAATPRICVQPRQLHRIFLEKKEREPGCFEPDKQADPILLPVWLASRPRQIVPDKQSLAPAGRWRLDSQETVLSRALFPSSLRQISTLQKSDSSPTPHAPRQASARLRLPSRHRSALLATRSYPDRRDLQLKPTIRNALQKLKHNQDRAGLPDRSNRPPSDNPR